MLTALLGSACLLQQSTFQNPVFAKNFPDPFIVQDGNRFLAYGTGLQVMESRDLIHWNHLGSLPKPEWSNGQYWAPEVYRWKGKWHMLFSARDKQSGKRDLAISTADKPEGPFTFAAKLVLGTSENTGTDDNGAIDGSLFIENGRPFLLYIREAPPRAIKIVRLAPDLLKVEGEAKPILTVDRPVEQGILDAPTLIKRDGYYWLFYSSGWFQSSAKDARYQVWAAKSKSLFGPYSKPDKPVLTTKEGETISPGHQCVFNLPSGEWWMAYHAWDTSAAPRYAENKNGRSLRLDRLVWTKDGPQCVGPTITPQTAPKIDKS
ncbi:MAG TPA: glycoside hydrolase family 43 protein [Fimbriimonadaceae bacterium]|nr:glycoside hydrolase family 43 protein [Fimbriimonadaceae bacterium]